MESGFEIVAEMLKAIEDTPATNEKIKKIRAFAVRESLFVKVVHYALNPYLRFGITGTCETKTLYNTGVYTIEECFSELDALAEAKGVSKAQKEKFFQMVGTFGKHGVSVVNKILNKDLRCGANVKTFIKASDLFVDLPFHYPMKGESDVNKFLQKAGPKKLLCWSYKLDGTRTWAIYNYKSDKCIYLSFNGLELPNFNCFDDAIKKHALLYAEKQKTKLNELVFDGEVVNIKGDFSRHMSEFRRLKNMDASGFRFFVFDLVLPDLPLIKRYGLLEHACELPIYTDENIEESELVTLLAHNTLRQNPQSTCRYAIKAGFEGIMLKRWASEYQYKRSWDWCKLKNVSTEDVPVIGKIEGKGKFSGVLGALIVKRNGVETEVGSGFTDEERLYFWTNPPKMIEIKFQEVLKSGALRFPVFVRVRDDK